MMTITDKEIIEWASDENSRHMQQNGQIDYLFEWLFRETDTLVDGTTRAQVDRMTQFQKIELLERLSKNQRMIGHDMLRDIAQFVEEIAPYKNGFRTADDYSPTLR